ncbi:hypothetical protein C2G38_2093507 [Gigaspora rosea]|uniref:Uncharacterized protein n=1 Tax=Gigaspora rosea TaxID=44941 RepID=A0A397UYM4_9GLOM|nr:hypothetical protein C2G38_2093507 [Gigaspora rosea]
MNFYAIFHLFIIISISLTVGHPLVIRTQSDSNLLSSKRSTKSEFVRLVATDDCKSRCKKQCKKLKGREWDNCYNGCRINCR